VIFWIDPVPATGYHFNREALGPGRRPALPAA
jgi:hypothetical protein